MQVIIKKTFISELEVGRKNREGFRRIVSPIWNGMIQDLQKQGYQIKAQNCRILIKK